MALLKQRRDGMQSRSEVKVKINIRKLNILHSKWIYDVTEISAAHRVVFFLFLVDIVPPLKTVLQSHGTQCEVHKERAGSVGTSHTSSFPAH